MIQAFKDERAKKLMEGLRVVELVNIEEQARTRLIRLDSATSLEDLRALRGNRLELLQLGGERTDRCRNHRLPLNRSS